MVTGNLEIIAANLAAAIVQNRVTGDRSSTNPKVPTAKETVEVFRECLGELQRLYKGQ
jgi:hypothetical protein